MALSARRSVWRRDAGTVSNAGRLTSIVALTEGGKRIPIFTARCSFRLELDGRQFRFDRLAEAEAFVAGWLLGAEGFPDDALPESL